MNVCFLGALAFLFSLLLMANQAWASDQNYGYRITTPGKTVIQIARDVFNDERQWKKIAYWNNLTPPYSLSVGQILVLPQKPTLKISEKNLVTGEQVPTPLFLQQLPSVSRVVWNRKGYFVYEVNERAPSLSMVALENYGDKKMWKFIARWNGLAPDERLSLSQKLILHAKPTLNAEQGNAVLVKEWLRAGNVPMAQRLGYQGGELPGHHLAKPVETVEPIQSVKSAEKTVHTESTQPNPQIQESDNSATLPAKKVQTIVTEPTNLGQPIGTAESTNPKIISPSDDPELAPKTEQLVERAQAPAQAPLPAPTQIAPTQQTTPVSISTITTAAPPASPTQTVTPIVPAQTVPPQAANPEPKIRKPSAANPTDSLQNSEPTSETYWLGSDTFRIIKSLSKPNGK